MNLDNRTKETLSGISTLVIDFICLILIMFSIAKECSVVLVIFTVLLEIASCILNIYYIRMYMKNKFKNKTLYVLNTLVIMFKTVLFLALIILLLVTIGLESQLIIARQNAGL